MAHSGKVEKSPPRACGWWRLDQPWASAARPGKAIPGRGHAEVKTLDIERGLPCWSNSFD